MLSHVHRLNVPDKSRRHITREIHLTKKPGQRPEE
jgi:hypothetical protein